MRGVTLAGINDALLSVSEFYSQHHGVFNSQELYHFVQFSKHDRKPVSAKYSGSGERWRSEYRHGCTWRSAQSENSHRQWNTVVASVAKGSPVAQEP